MDKSTGKQLTTKAAGNLLEVSLNTDPYGPGRYLNHGDQDDGLVCLATTNMEQDIFTQYQANVDLTFNYTGANIITGARTHRSTQVQYMAQIADVAPLGSIMDGCAMFVEVRCLPNPCGVGEDYEFGILCCGPAGTKTDGKFSSYEIIQNVSSGVETHNEVQGNCCINTMEFWHSYDLETYEGEWGDRERRLNQFTKRDQSDRRAGEFEPDAEEEQDAAERRLAQLERRLGKCSQR